MTGKEQPAGAVVIGASLGAIDALQRILPDLPADLPEAVMVVVHVPRGRESLLAEIFTKKCRMRVKEAEDKESLAGGTIYFAPPDYHLLVNRDRTLALSSDDPVHFSRPSIDVLFESAAAAFGPALTGVVLTGANADGADGLRAVEAGGGRVAVQCPDSAECSVMPAAARAACRGALSLQLKEIGSFLNERRNS